VAIFCEKQGYLADEPLWVKLLARNESGKTLKVHVAGPDWMVMADFKIVRVADGQVVKVRPYRNERERLVRFSGHATYVQIEPARLVSPGFVNLQKLFDLGPGTYNISANCHLTSPDDAKKLVSVPSNQITVSIIAK
jgi:hypothetical protein